MYIDFFGHRANFIAVELACNGRCQEYQPTFDHFSIVYTFILCLRMPYIF